MSTLEIRVGESWKWDAEYLRLLQSDDLCADLYAIQDFIEIIADGLALTEKLSEDSILYILMDLARGLLELCEKSTRKCVVQFYEHPYELVVTLEGSFALLSFYSLSGPREVVVRDHPVLFSSLLTQVANNIDALYQEIVHINHDLKEDAFLKEFTKVSKQLQKVFAKSFSKKRPKKSVPPKRYLGPQWNAKETGPFSLSFWVNALDIPLRNYRAETPVDLHSLLFAGQLGFRGAGIFYDTQVGYPFLMIEDIVSAAQSLVSSVEQGDNRPHAVVEISYEKLFLTLDKGVVTITVPTTQSKNSSRAQISLKNFVNAVVNCALALAKILVELAPFQKENEKVKDLILEAEELQLSLTELHWVDVENDNPTPYQSAVRKKRSTKKKNPKKQIALGKIKRLVFAPKFSLEVDFCSLLSVSNRSLIISSGERLWGIDRQKGRPLWEMNQTKQITFSDASGKILLSSFQEQLIHKIDPKNGKFLWEARVEGRNPSLEGPPVLFLRKGRARLIVPTVDKRLLCLESTTGRLLFSANASRHGMTRICHRGRLLYGAGEDGSLFAIDADNGEIVFRRKKRNRFFTTPLVIEDQVLYAASSAGEARLLAIHAYRGSLLWERGIGISMETPPVLLQDNSILALAHSEEGLRILRINPQQGEVLWVVALSQNPGRAAAPVVVDDTIFVVDDTGILHAHALQSGKEIFTVDLGTDATNASYLPPTPVIKNDLLFVATDTVYVIQPKTGQILGRVIECPAPPERLFVNDNLEIVLAADDDFIASYRLATHLSVVV